MYVTIPFFLHKMLASHRQPTFRDRRWTKYSNLEEKIGRHPLPQMSKLKNVCVICHAVGFDLFCPPVSTLGRRQQLWNLGGAGDKVVQGLNNLSIYCIFSRMFPFKHERLWIFCLDDHQTLQGTVVSWLLPMVKLARDLTRQKKKKVANSKGNGNCPIFPGNLRWNVMIWPEWWWILPLEKMMFVGGLEVVKFLGNFLVSSR